jgi:hypothetical protein
MRMIRHNSLMDPTGKKGRPRGSWLDGVTEAMVKKGDGGRRRPGLDTLEKKIGKAADSRISPPHTY